MRDVIEDDFIHLRYKFHDINSQEHAKFLAEMSSAPMRKRATIMIQKSLTVGSIDASLPSLKRISLRHDGGGYSCEHMGRRASTFDSLSNGCKIG